MSFVRSSLSSLSTVERETFRCCAMYSCVLPSNSMVAIWVVRGVSVRDMFCVIFLHTLYVCVVVWYVDRFICGFVVRCV